jgi:hypothetical protein
VGEGGRPGPCGQNREGSCDGGVLPAPSHCRNVQMEVSLPFMACRPAHCSGLRQSRCHDTALPSWTERPAFPGAAFLLTLADGVARKSLPAAMGVCVSVPQDVRGHGLARANVQGRGADATAFVAAAGPGPAGAGRAGSRLCCQRGTPVAAPPAEARLDTLSQVGDE